MDKQDLINYLKSNLSLELEITENTWEPVLKAKIFIRTNSGREEICSDDIDLGYLGKVLK